MNNSRIYADLQKTDDLGRLILSCLGTQRDLQKNGIALREGLTLDFWMDDGDEEGNFDPLYFEGTVHYDSEAKHWVAVIDWDAIRNASEEATSPQIEKTAA